MTSPASPRRLRARHAVGHQDQVALLLGGVVHLFAVLTSAPTATPAATPIKRRNSAISGSRRVRRPLREALQTVAAAVARSFQCIMPAADVVALGVAGQAWWTRARRPLARCQRLVLGVR